MDCNVNPKNVKEKERHLDFVEVDVEADMVF